MFAFWPTTMVVAASADDTPLEVITLPPLELPPPPEALARPAPPVPGVDIPDDVVIPKIRDLWKDPPELPAPPPGPSGSETSGPAFVPYTVAPRILNAPAVLRAAEREYPALLRDAGIGGTVELLVHVSREGEVTRVEIGTSSGHAALDRAALRVAGILEMSPALNRDTRVAVLTRVPIVFRVR